MPVFLLGMKFILGKKIGMTQIFEGGKAIPLTLVEAGPCEILQIKIKAKDGYEAWQIGFEKILKQKKIKKTMKGKEYRYLREYQEREGSDRKVGDNIDLGIFQEGDKVRISAVSKGKGFAGAVKKWGFHGRQSASHGTKHELRTVGSVGASGVGRVLKGRKMPGRMGGQRVSVKNLPVVKIDKENNIMAIRGGVPGRKGALLEIRGS